MPVAQLTREGSPAATALSAVSVAATSEPSPLRVELFSDAVFAVAITLLVLNLPLTRASGSLLHALADRWASFAGFGISFALLGCVWVSHYRLLRRGPRIDGPFLFLNLLVLMSIVLVPFGTSTIATFVVSSGDQSHLAAALFAAILVFMSTSFGALNVLVRRRSGVHANEAHGMRGRLRSLQPMFGGFVNGAGIGVAFISPVATLAMTGGVAGFYFIESLVHDDAC